MAERISCMEGEISRLTSRPSRSAGRPDGPVVGGRVPPGVRLVEAVSWAGRCGRPEGSPPDLASGPRRSSCPEPSSSQEPEPRSASSRGPSAGSRPPSSGGFAIAAALERAGITPDQVDYVFMGQVLQAGAGQITARQAAVKAGIPMAVPATTVNKVCLSGLNAIYLADLMINAGEADIVVAGGMESMTQAPYLLPGARAGYRLGDATVVDSMMYDGLFCAFDQCAMGLGTERYNGADGVSREPPGRLQPPSPTNGRRPRSRKGSSPTRSSR